MLYGLLISMFLCSYHEH